MTSGQSRASGSRVIGCRDNAVGAEFAALPDAVRPTVRGDVRHELERASGKRGPIEVEVEILFGCWEGKPRTITRLRAQPNYQPNIRDQRVRCVELRASDAGE